MGLDTCTCDSCKEPTDSLIPLAVLDELPTGGMGMIKRWYCWDCYQTQMEEAEENATDEEEENDPKKKEDNTKSIQLNGNYITFDGICYFSISGLSTYNGM